MEGMYGIQQGYNPMAAAMYASQPYATPQGVFGGAVSPLSGLMGSGIPGLLNGQNLGRQPGAGIDGFGGMLQPYGNIDPMTAAQIQQPQAQLAQLVQQAQLAQHLAQQQFGRSPFGFDPISAAVVQQRAQFGQQAQLAPWLSGNPLNRVDPITAAYIQQAQIAQLFQQLALQGQLGQQNQIGHQFGQGHFGQGQFGLGQPGQGQPGQAWFGGGALNPWASLQFAAQYGRAVPLQYGPTGNVGGYGGQLPVY